MGKKMADIIILLFCFSLSTFFLPLVSAVEDSWTSLEPMPTARLGLGVAVVGGRIYAITGSDGAWINCTEEYNPETDTWTIKSAIPTIRSELATAVYQNKIYVIGGWGTSGVTGTNEVYDTVSDTWETKASMPTDRTDLVANQVNGKIYVMAGKKFTSYSWPVLCNQTEIYDPLTDSWTTGAAMPNFNGTGPEIASKSENVASAVIDNKIYVIVEQTLHIYDIQTNLWSYGTDLPTYIKGIAACATTGTFAPKRLHVVGSDAHYVYDPDTDEWTSATPIPNSRYWVELAVTNDRLYAVGGFNTNGEVLAVNELYTPIGYIPEFPSWVILLLFLASSLTAVIYRKKLHRKPN
jgi:N-acetylneuraminic acid mutarotase